MNDKQELKTALDMSERDIFDYEYTNNNNVEWRPIYDILGHIINDKQELKTALDMSERDIFDYDDNNIEWQYGDECCVKNVNNIFIYGCEFPWDDTKVIIFREDKRSYNIVNKSLLVAPTYDSICDFSLNAAFKLMCDTLNITQTKQQFEYFKEHEEINKMWLKIVELTNYTEIE